DEPAMQALIEAASRARRAGRLVEAGRFELAAADAADRLGRADESFDRRFQAADDMSNSAPMATFAPVAESLAARAGNDRQRGRAALAMAQVHVQRGEIGEAAHHIATGLSAARAADDRRVEAELLYGDGYVHHWHRRLDAGLRSIEAAIAILDEAGLLERASEMRMSLSVVLRDVGRVREAEAVVETMTRHSHEINSPDVTAKVWSLLATLRLDTGDPDGAREAMRHALAAAIDADFSVPSWAGLAADRMHLEWQCGDYAQALRTYEEARSDRRWTPSAHLIRAQRIGAETMLELGRYDLVRTALQQIVGRVEAGVHAELLVFLELRAGIVSAPAFFGTRPREAIKRITGVRGQTLLLAYFADALPARTARALLREAIERAEAGGMRGYLAGLHAVHARVLHDAGQSPLAVDAARQALDYQQRHASVVYRPLVWLRCAQILLAACERQAAVACLGEGRRWIDRVAASLPDAYRDSFLDRNPVNRELRGLASRELAATR
ncbi:MAG TPA: hypothetical protein VNS61_00420, partial [Caldimonas sp.]|nr:hypothetical protein [Caldimonas sp.]